MNISQTGLDLIKQSEGLETTAYLCPAGVWTIGYGHTHGVKRGDAVTGRQAEEYLREDLQVAEPDGKHQRQSGTDAGPVRRAGSVRVQCWRG